MQRPLIACAAALTFATALPAFAQQDLNVTGANGQRLAVMANVPAGEGPFPAVVLAPGQGYHMALPALEATARALVDQGVAVFRFNWGYYSAEPKGRPSAELADEVNDFKAVLAAVRKHPKVDAQNISAAGKSLGSAVAWMVFTADMQLKSALLLTPICSRVPQGGTQPRPEAKDNYEGFEAERRPTLWISGDKDPLCATSVLYGFAAARADTARVGIVGGDHGFEHPALPPAAAEAALKRNLAAVSALAAGFVAEASAVKQ